MTTRDKIERLKTRIKTGSGMESESDKTQSNQTNKISRADAEKLLEFSKQLDLLKSEYGDYRHEKLLRHCVILAEEVGGLAEALESRDAAEDIVRWINTERSIEEYSEDTNRDYRVAIRIFGKRVLRSDEVPPSLSWIPTGYTNSFNPAPKRAEMLEWSEVKQMAEKGAENTRDKALFPVSHELGPRGEENHEIRLGQISDSDHGIQIHLDGKQGEHAVTLINSTPYLQKWLSEHPASDDPDAYLWCKKSDSDEEGTYDSYDPGTYQSFSQRFKAAGKRAGIKKPVTPTNFRKSNTFWLAKKGANESLINERQGRSPTSDHARRYIAAFGPENENNTYARLQGLDVEAEATEDRTPLRCPRCDKETPRDEPFCVWCHQAMTTDAVNELEEQEKKQRRELLRIAQENPELLDAVEQLEPLIETLGGDAQVIQTARRFAESSN